MFGFLQRLVDKFDEFVENQLFEGEEWVVNIDDSHFKFYKWWLDHDGGNSPGYRENFCHYWRVVVGHVPLIWFFLEPLWWQIRPWMVLTVIADLILYRIEVSLWRHIAVLIFGFAAIQLSDSPRINRAIHWFFGARKFLVIRPVTVLFVAVAVLHGIISRNAAESVELLIGGGVFLVFLAALYGVVTIGFVVWDFFSDWRWERRQRSYRKSDQARFSRVPQRKGFLSLVIQAAAARKRKICPYVRLPEGY